MAEHLKMRLEPGETEVYLPEIDGYINIREDGLITIKKASGQECFQCKLWDIESKRIPDYRISQKVANRIWGKGGR